MNTISKTNIEWCDYVYNPVWGCKNNCPYCYARKIAKRFWNVIYKKEIEYNKNKNTYYKWLEDYLLGLVDFKPVFLDSNYNKKFPKKASNIFVNSMSDVYCWSEVWMKKVIEKIKNHQRHNFIFLTKKPEIYLDYQFPKNCFLGATFTKESDFKFLYLLDFISIEPIQEKIDLSNFSIALSEKLKWIIIGMESGNRKDKIIPDLRWILEIFNFCYDKNIPIFMKDNLKDICDVGLVQEFPEALKNGK